MKKNALPQHQSRLAGRCGVSPLETDQKPRAEDGGGSLLGQNRRFWLLIFLTVLLIAGVVLRLGLLVNSDRELHWDSAWYYQAAQDALSGKLVADCCTHGAGYPLFLSGILGIFGRDNLEVARLVQVVVDSGVALLLGAAALTLFGRGPGIATFFIYFLNPFTSAHTGLILTETMAISLVALLLYASSRPKFSRRPLLWLSGGFLVGLLFLTKPGFVWFVPVYLLFTAAVIAGWRSRVHYLAVSLGGVLLISIYPLISFSQAFGTPRLVPPYGPGAWAIWASLYSGYTPELLVEFQPPNSEWVRVNQQYWYWVLKDMKKLPKYEYKYRQLVLAKAFSDWPALLKMYIRNSLLFWDKRHLYTYTDPFYPADQVPLRLLNLGYFFLAGAGVVLYSLRQAAGNKFFLVTSVGLLVYMGTLFPLVSNLSRHSLPFYPVLFVWAGYGGWALWARASRRARSTDNS